MSYVEALRLLGRLPSNAALRTLAPMLGPRSLPDMRAWLRRAGHTESDLTRLRCIHVAGTKGKGTVAAYAAHLLKASRGHMTGGSGGGGVSGPVGLYTSPHVVSVRERIAIDGQPISQADFARFFFEVYDAVRASRGSGLGPKGVRVVEGNIVNLPEEEIVPGYFPFLTLLAFHTFLRLGIRDAVIECGIGGEYDSTNILPPEAVSAAVITQIGSDHADMLGKEPHDIAWHKAGIIKPGVPVITSPSAVLRHPPSNTPSIRSVLLKRWREAGASPDIIELNSDKLVAWVRDRWTVGPGQGWNTPNLDVRNKATAAVAAMTHLKLPLDSRDPLAAIPDWMQSELRFERASLRGRREIHRRGRVAWVLDGAHTLESVRQFAMFFDKFSRGKSPSRRLFVLFNQQERAVKPLVLAMLEKLQNPITAAFCSRNEITCTPGANLEKQERARDIMIRGGVCADRIRVTDNVTDAVRQIEAMAEAELVAGAKSVYVIVTGSFKLVGNALRVLEGIDEAVV